MAYAKTQREKLGRLVTEIQAIIDKGKQQGHLTSAQREKYHALEKDFTATEDNIKAIEAGNSNGATIDQFPVGRNMNSAQIERLQDTFRLTAGQRRALDLDPHARAFSAYLAGGMEKLDDEARSVMSGKFVSNFQNAQSTSGSQGGYLVPQGFQDELTEAMKWFGGVEGTVGTFKTSTGNPWPWPLVNDTTNKGRIIGQNVQVIETDLVFSQQMFSAYIGSSDLVVVPLALMEDSAFDLDGLVARLLGTRLGRLYNERCTIGTGVNEPTGIVTATVAAGNVFTLSAGSTASIAYANLVDLEHSVDPAYRYNPASRWMFSDSVLKLLKKLVDSSNRPLWQPGISASFRQGAPVDLFAVKPTILDHEYVINQDMPIPAANAYSVLFGDMSTFKVRDVASGTTVLRLVERYADYLQIGFIAFRRFDSNLIDAGTHPIAVMRQSGT